jgi:phosphoribosylglycinamide formyltransferase
LALQPYLKANPDKTRDDYDREVSMIVLAASPDLVILAGWMHILGDAFLKEVERENVSVINLHPALPGAFDGANSIHRAFDAFGRGEIEHSGVMVHKVIREVDRGEPVLVRTVEIKKEDTLEDFEARLHQTEWGVIVEAAKIALESRRYVFPSHRELDCFDASLVAGIPRHRTCIRET